MERETGPQVYGRAQGRSCSRLGSMFGQAQYPMLASSGSSKYRYSQSTVPQSSMYGQPQYAMPSQQSANVVGSSGAAAMVAAAAMGHGAHRGHLGD
ncbi:hypothetical protein MRX96_023239 [Rhipicephalus microplus]